MAGRGRNKEFNLGHAEFEMTVKSLYVEYAVGYVSLEFKEEVKFWTLLSRLFSTFSVPDSVLVLECFNE